MLIVFFVSGDPGSSCDKSSIYDGDINCEQKENEQIVKETQDAEDRLGNDVQRRDEI